MKKKLIILSGILSVMLLAGNVYAAAPDRIEKIFKSAEKINTSVYPDADTVLLFNEENIRYEADGLSVSTDEYYQKILTETGRKQLRSCTFHFNSTYGSLKVEKAVVLRNGRTIVIDPEKNSKISIEPGQMGSNIYDPANKILSLAVPQLEVGDILGLKIKSVVKKARIPGFWGNYISLQGNMPILHYAVNINAPAEKPLRSIVIKDPAGSPVKFTEEKRGGRIHYRWVAGNVPQAIPEPDMPPLYTAVQRLLVGTAENWTEISKWYYTLCRPRLDTIDDAIKKKVKELTANCRSRDEKIMALFQFVSQKIRYMGITPESEAPGYEPHDVTLTFHQRYGVCRDKAALLVAMLEAAGLKAYPVLIMAGIPKDDDVPNAYFNHAVTAVEDASGRYILMDPTNESARELFPATLGNCSYLVAKPEGDKLRRTPSPDSARNRLTIAGNAALDGNGTLSGDIKLDFTGVNDLIYRDAFSRWTPEEAEQYFSRCLGRAIPGAELTGIEIFPVPVRDMSKPLQVKLRYTAEEIFTSSRPTVLQLPELGDEIGASGFLLGSFALDKRRFKLKLPSTFSVDEHYRMTLPCHLKILSLPEPEKIAEDNLIHWSRSVAHKDGVLEGRRRFSVDSLEYSPEEYRKTRSVLQKMDMKKRALPVAVTDYKQVKNDKIPQIFAGADTLVLQDWKKYTLQNSTRWVEESRRKFRILTYAGLKDASELRISYNPVWEQVTVSGKVISPAGKEKVLNDLEKNQMDAPWNASAPRYPGAKILVANLPGVEIGSTVEVNIKRVVRRPWFSAVMLFGSYAPEIERIRIIDLPERMRINFSDLPAGVMFRQKTTGARRILSWRSVNTRRIPAERTQADLWTLTPTVMVSTGKWHNIAGNMNRIFIKLSDPAKNPDSVKLARALTAKLPDGGEVKERLQRKVKALRDHAAQSIRPAGPGVDELPLENLSCADVTMRSGYGNSADRAILLGAMLRALDIEVQFVPMADLLYADRVIRGFERFPQRIFSGVLLYVPALDLYLNDTSQYARMGTLNSADRVMLSLTGGRLESLRVPLRHESRRNSRIRLDIKADGSADIRITELCFGADFERANRRFSEFTPELRKRHFAELASVISRAAVIKGTPVTDFKGYPGKIEYTIHCPGFTSKTGRFRTFELPFFNVFANAAGTVRKSRKTPFQRNSSFSREIRYEITFPAEYRVARNRSTRLQYGDYTVGTFTQDQTVSNGKLSINCRIKVPAGIIPAEDCGKLFTLRKTLARPNAGRIVLISEK